MTCLAPWASGVWKAKSPRATSLEAECTNRFPEGRYGIPLTHSAIAFVKPTLDGFSPLYVQRLPIAIATSADCEYVYTGDIFRLVESPTALFAGCIGDFNDAGQPDMALLMKRQRDGRILPVVFRSQGEIRGHADRPYYGPVRLQRECELVAPAVVPTETSERSLRVRSGRQGDRRGRPFHYRVAHVFLEHGCQPLRCHPQE